MELVDLVPIIIILIFIVGGSIEEQNKYHNPMEMSINKAIRGGVQPCYFFTSFMSTENNRIAF